MKVGIPEIITGNWESFNGVSRPGRTFDLSESRCSDVEFTGHSGLVIHYGGRFPGAKTLMK